MFKIIVSINCTVMEALRLDGITENELSDLDTVRNILQKASSGLPMRAILYNAIPGCYGISKHFANFCDIPIDVAEDISMREHCGGKLLCYGEYLVAAYPIIAELVDTYLSSSVQRVCTHARRIIGIEKTLEKIMYNRQRLKTFLIHPCAPLANKPASVPMLDKHTYALLSYRGWSDYDKDDLDIFYNSDAYDVIVSEKQHDLMELLWDDTWSSLSANLAAFVLDFMRRVVALPLPLPLSGDDTLSFMDIVQQSKCHSFIDVLPYLWRHQSFLDMTIICFITHMYMSTSTHERQFYEFFKAEAANHTHSRQVLYQSFGLMAASARYTQLDMAYAPAFLAARIEIVNGHESVLIA